MVLEEPVFALAGIDPTEDLKIETDGKSLKLKQYEPTEEKKNPFIKKLVKCDEGFRLALEEPVFALVGFDSKKKLEIKTDGKSLILMQGKSDREDNLPFLDFDLTPKFPSRKRRETGSSRKRFGFPKKQPW